MLTGTRAVGLIERLKNPGLVLRTDADSRIVDRYPQRRCLLRLLLDLGRDKHFATLGEFDRIPHQYERHLPESRRIAEDLVRNIRAKLAGQLQALGCRGAAHHFEHAFEYRRRVELTALQLEGRGLDLGEIENVADDFHQGGAAAFD